MKTLFPFQELGVQFLARSKRKALLLADDMGLGKSIQAVRAAADLRAKKILVVCPAHLKIHWRREIETELGYPVKTDLVEGGDYKINKEANVIIVNYDLLHRMSIFSQLTALVFAVGIFDEAHYLKTVGSKRTKAVFTKGGIASRCFYKWFLTGTPVLNRPVELFPLLKAAAPDTIHPYASFSAFAKRWCGGYFDGYLMHADGATNIEDLNNRLTKSGFMLRRKKEEVLKDLPEKTYQIIPVTVASGKTETKFMTWTKADAKRVELGEVDAAELAVYRHELAKDKLKHVEAHIEETLLEKEKLVVFAYHRDIIERLTKRFQHHTPAVIYGGVAAAKRDSEVLRFQGDKRCRLFIGQITAAGTGITLTASDTALFAEISWVPGEIFQAVDRIHRIGQHNRVLVQFIVVEDSIEEYMLRTVIDKKTTIEKIVEKEPDSDYLFS